MRKGRVFAAILVLVLVLVRATAAAAQPPDPNKPQFALGLAVISSPEPYRGVDDDPLVVPAISFSYKRFYFRGIYAGFTLFERNGLQVDVIARPRLAGYDAEDSPFLAGMEDRRISADLGFEVEWEGEWFGLSLTPVADVLDRSGGQEVSLDLFKAFRRGPFRIEPRLGVVWQSADSTDYYYGVRPEEALPGRPAYELDDAAHLTGGVFAFAPVTRKLVFQGFVRAERLSGEVADSPIVDRDLGITGFAALSYQF
jgi:outer membrane protein